MNGEDLKRAAEFFFHGRSLGPEFIKEWSRAKVLTADEAETVRRGLDQAATELRAGPQRWPLIPEALALLSPPEAGS